MTGVAVTAYPWALGATPLPFLMLRQILAGHFAARHDRDRMFGLFEAAQGIHASMGHDDVRGELIAAASRLLRCPDASIGAEPPGPEQLGAAVDGREGDWLVVSGRSRSEPFDEADRQLLAALSAVAASALSNAGLYQEVRRQREQLATIMGSLAEGVCAIDAAGRVTFANPAAHTLLGWAPEHWGTVPDDAPDAGAAAISRLAEFALKSGRSVSGESAALSRLDGSRFPVSYTAAPIFDGDGVTGAVVAFRDMTERIEFERELEHQAYHDQLTGLPNRRMLLDRLEQAMRRSLRSGGAHAVLFADVDRFKLINDGLGHQAGDQLLAVIASRLRTLVRPGDTVARFGGDEFTILVEDIADIADAEVLAARILAAMHAPIAVDGRREVIASLSIGIAATEGRGGADDVLHDADLAMYEAKAAGTGQFHRYDAVAMQERSAERLDLETELRHALDAGQIEVHYQPLVDTTAGRVVDVEALVRWRHPGNGLLMPAEFIGIAEETSLILPLGRAVLQQACEQAGRWYAEYGVRIGMSVNLSARQFSDPDLVTDVASALELTGISPDQLCLEITEGVAMYDIDLTIGVLGRLKALGLRLAIDDFGTGYSSLNYLKRFPVDVVKIDRSFVQDIETSPADRAIVAAVVGLARTLDITIVAEGVETQRQLDCLRSLGCPVVQGYYFAPPLTATQTAALFLAGPPTPRPSSDARAGVLV